jgi:hypothetical protein
MTSRMPLRASRPSWVLHRRASIFRAKQQPPLVQRWLTWAVASVRANYAATGVGIFHTRNGTSELKHLSEETMDLNRHTVHREWAAQRIKPDFGVVTISAAHWPENGPYMRWTRAVGDAVREPIHAHHTQYMLTQISAPLWRR